MHPNLLTQTVIGAAMKAHRELGPGHDEIAYEKALAFALHKGGIRVQAQRPVPVEYKGIRLDCGYRLDLLVEGELVVEVKSVEAVLPVHEAQLVTYLRLCGRHLGLLINFNEAMLKDGIRRRVYNFDDGSVLLASSGRFPMQSNAETQRAQRKAADELTERIIGAAVEVHRHFGPGLLVSAYKSALAHELKLQRLSFEWNQPVQLIFEHEKIQGGSKIDFIVEDSVVLKILAVDIMTPLYKSQLLSQLRFSGKRLGLLINFNTPLLREGIQRCIYDSPKQSFSAPSVSLR